MDFAPVPGVRYISENICEFVLWAPHATIVQLILVHPRQKTLFPEKNGDYWRIRLNECNPGTRYFYKIDDKEPMPDPVSIFQPLGVFGPSEVFRFPGMEWEDSRWKTKTFKDLIIYELHIGTFSSGGRFDGVISKLDYLIELGINAIEIMPVAQFSGGRNWGYDGVFPYAVQHSYGGPAGLMLMVNECHKKGISVILDVVYNHLGPEGNFTQEFAPYMSNIHSTAWGKGFNFDGEHSGGVRNFFIRNVLMWFRDFHIDGLRLDAVHAMHDTSETHIISKLSEVVKEYNAETGKNHFLIGEVNRNDVAYTQPVSKGGFGLDAQWNDDFHHALHVTVTGEKKGYYMDFTGPDCLLKVLKNAFYLNGSFSKFHGHKFGKPARKTPAEKFIVYSQNHDQVGNRRYGERLSTLVGFEKLKQIATLVLMSPFVPMLFMGEEYGETNPFLFFIDFKNPWLNNLVKKGREKEYRMLGYKTTSKGYDPTDFHAFESSILNNSIINNNSQSSQLFKYYKNLIQIRKSHAVISNADRSKMVVELHGKVLYIERWQGRNKVKILFNLAIKPVRYILFPDGRKYYKIIDSTAKQFSETDSTCPDTIGNTELLNLKGESAIIYSTINLI